MRCDKGCMLDEQRCDHAARVICGLIENECQGFILPPSEARRLLGRPEHFHTWYLHRSVSGLEEHLAAMRVPIKVNRLYGISFALYRIPRGSLAGTFSVQ